MPRGLCGRTTYLEAAPMFAQHSAQIVSMVASMSITEFGARPQLQNNMHLVPIRLYGWAVYGVAARMCAQKGNQIVFMVA
eukprot:9164777-Alexandrium_andersonii.AAC.1